MKHAGGLDWLGSRASEPIREVATGERGMTGLVRDGLLTEIWPGLARANDLAPGPADRARVISHLVPRDGVVVRQAAVWVHTGRHRPARVDVVLVGARRRSTSTTLVHSEEVGPVDVVRLGGVAVASMARTAVDVARRAGQEDALCWIATLRAAGLDAAELRLATAAASGLPGVARARRLLAPVS